MRPAAPPPSSLRSGQRGLGGPGRGRSQGLEVPQALAAVTARLPARLPAAARGNEALWAPPFSRRISSRLRVEAQGRRRPAPPAATMCDCFHVVLPTWPGAPGSGAPHPRLQPASLGRVGSAGELGRDAGAQCGTGCARGRKGRRDGMGTGGPAGPLCFLVPRRLCGSLHLVCTRACSVRLPPFPVSAAAHFVSRVSITLCGCLRSRLAGWLCLSLTFSSRCSCNPLGPAALPSKAATTEGGRCASYWMEQAQGEQAPALG